MYDSFALRHQVISQGSVSADGTRLSAYLTLSSWEPSAGHHWPVALHQRLHICAWLDPSALCKGDILVSSVHTRARFCQMETHVLLSGRATRVVSTPGLEGFCQKVWSCPDGFASVSDLAFLSDSFKYSCLVLSSPRFNYNMTWGGVFWWCLFQILSIPRCVYIFPKVWEVFCYDFTNRFLCN